MQNLKLFFLIFLLIKKKWINLIVLLKYNIAKPIKEKTWPTKETNKERKEECKKLIKGLQLRYGW